MCYSLSPATSAYEVPESTMEVLNHELTDNLTVESLDFFVVARAIRDFLESEGTLPVSGVVPDMVSPPPHPRQYNDMYFQTPSHEDTYPSRHRPQHSSSSFKAFTRTKQSNILIKLKIVLPNYSQD